MESEEDENIIVKRKPKKVKRYIASDSESETENRILPRPPKIKPLAKKITSGKHSKKIFYIKHLNLEGYKI